MSFLPRSVGFALICAALVACDGSLYYTSDPIEAWVVDAETGKPIEGAIVTANWQLLSFGLDTGGRKLHQLAVMETVTDGNGRFYFPGFTKLNLTLAELGEDDPQIRIFKPGYDYSGLSSDHRMRSERHESHRHSRAIGMTFKLSRMSSIREYTHQMDSLNTDLGSIANYGDLRKIPKMVHALNCEKLRIKKIDASILFDVPPMTEAEVHCADH